MKTIVTILLLTFTASFAFAQDLTKLEEKYNRFYQQATGEWEQIKCGNGIKSMQPTFDKYLTNCYNKKDIGSGNPVIKDVYNKKSFEEVFEIQTKEFKDETLALAKSFPQSTSKVDKYGYAYYGQDGVYLSVDICEYLYTKNQEGFVEVMYSCAF